MYIFYVLLYTVFWAWYPTWCSQTVRCPNQGVVAYHRPGDVSSLVATNFETEVTETLLQPYGSKYLLWLVVHPSENMSSSVGMINLPIICKNKHVPNHQPVLSKYLGMI